ncbi:MAG: homocysteine S-methyltransferase family protein [Acidobacteriia bacterium]|nr:homocysteine S-methyltransferase family protein [Terriglobia bacterium]
MPPLLQDLLSHAPVITDGALGTQLLARGLASGECPDTWNLSRPADVEEVIRSYVDAGSEIVLTNTFRANRIALAGYGLAGKIEDLNLAGVEIARRAAAGRAAVFASVGPSGKMLAAGEVAEADLRQAFSEQAQILAAAGVDGFAIETMSDLEEAKVAVATLRATGLPVVVSLVFDSGKEKDRTMTGVTPEKAAEELTAAGADVIGANCGRGIAGYISVCQRLHASTDRPIWIKPNAGLPEMFEGKVVYRTTPEEFASFIPALLQAGASFIGGCCGTGPDFIRAAGDTLRRWRRR